MDHEQAMLSIGQLSERSGASVSALRFYEDEGLLTSERTSGNQRRYRRDVLRRVAFIRTSQRVGMSLAAIREALQELPDGRAPSPDDWERISRSWREELDARIADLQRLRDDLTGCIGCGCLSLRSCAFQNPGDHLARHGPGAVRWQRLPRPG